MMCFLGVLPSKNTGANITPWKEVIDTSKHTFNFPVCLRSPQEFGADVITKDLSQHIAIAPINGRFPLVGRGRHGSSGSSQGGPHAHEVPAGVSEAIFQVCETFVWASREGVCRDDHPLMATTLTLLRRLCQAPRRNFHVSVEVWTV